MTYFISLSEGAQWIRVKCPTMKYRTLIKKLYQSGLKQFTVIFRCGKVWDCNLTRILKKAHNWRHIFLGGRDYWKKMYNELLKVDLLSTEQSNEIKFQDLTFKI